MRADWIKLMIVAARLPLRRDPANNQLERPSAHGLIWFSTWLLADPTPMPNVAGYPTPFQNRRIIRG